MAPDWASCPGQTMQRFATTSATYAVLQPESRAVRLGGVSGCFLMDHRLDGLKPLTVNDDWITVPANVAGIFQQALDLVLIPFWPFLAVWDTPLSILTIFCPLL